MDFFRHLSIEPAQILYGLAAITGGVARYLNAFTTGVPFSFSLFLASTFVSGFSGYMFALLGTSMQLPNTFIFIMAGTGGFFGDQTMKLLYDTIKKRTDVI